MRNWRTMRMRPAPSAERIAISRTRAAVRARSRLATLTQATSRTMPTAPSRTSNELRVEPVTTSFKRRTMTRRPAVDGPAIALSSCCAASSPTPGRSRATTESNRPSHNRRHLPWNPQIDAGPAVRELELRRHDTDNGQSLAVKVQRVTHGGRGRAEMRERKCVGNDRNVRRIVGGDRPAGQWRGSEEGEQPLFRRHNRKLLRLAHTEQIGAGDLVCDEPCEQTAMTAKLLEIGGPDGSVCFDAGGAPRLYLVHLH